MYALESFSSCVALGCLCAWTVVANVLVFVVLYKNPRLQTVPNLLVGNLAFSDLCLGCVVLPLSAVYAVTLHWPFGKLACEIWISTDVLSCTASIWNLSMIGLDRYWAITSPITYITKRNMRSAVLMILSIWGLSSLISLAPFLGWRQYSEKGNYFIDIETHTSHCQFLELPAYTLYSATGSFYIPLLVMFFVYFQIYRAFADHRARQIYRDILVFRQKVIKKHIESTILHEISRVLPTSDEFAKEGDDDEEEEEEEEEEESENDNINEDDEEDEESDRPNKKKNSQLEEESGNGPPTTSGGSTSGSTSGIPETTNVAVATVKLRQLTPAPSILKTTNQLRYNAVRCNCDENHAINTNSNNSNDKLARTNELTMNEKSPLKKTSSVVGPDAVNQRRKTTCISRKKSAPAKAAHQDGVAGTAAAPSRAKAGKALQFSSHPPSARFPSTKPHSQKHHDRRRQVAHPTKGVY
uniref:G-protein coupled receptors family 1 profile domain-containing protein n=1 Tax=Romanomermis culicivorax TaxID=13658 RepID=A0A915HKH4_ROMCU